MFPILFFQKKTIVEKFIAIKFGGKIFFRTSFKFVSPLNANESNFESK